MAGRRSRSSAYQDHLTPTHHGRSRGKVLTCSTASRRTAALADSPAAGEAYSHCATRSWKTDDLEGMPSAYLALTRYITW